ncbi:hypothetical protein ANTRET_LOCUS10246 [Anthophora retusa]
MNRTRFKRETISNSENFQCGIDRLIRGTPSSGRRVATRDSRAGEEDWTKRKKQNKTSKAEEAEEHKSKRRAKARRVEAELRRK